MGVGLVDLGRNGDVKERDIRQGLGWKKSWKNERFGGGDGWI